MCRRTSRDVQEGPEPHPALARREAVGLELLDADADLVGGLADQIRRLHRALDEGPERRGRCNGATRPAIMASCRLRRPADLSSATSPAEAGREARVMRFRDLSPRTPTRRSSRTARSASLVETRMKTRRSAMLTPHCLLDGRLRRAHDVEARHHAGRLVHEPARLGQRAGTRHAAL